MGRMSHDWIGRLNTVKTSVHPKVAYDSEDLIRILIFGEL